MTYFLGAFGPICDMYIPGNRYGKGDPDGALNYDELVVYKEEAVLPYAIVRYRFVKKKAQTEPAALGASAAPATAGPVAPVVVPGAVMPRDELVQQQLATAESTIKLQADAIAAQVHADQSRAANSGMQVRDRAAEQPSSAVQQLEMPPCSRRCARSSSLLRPLQCISHRDS